MPAEVKVLVEGFTNADSEEKSGEEKTQPTITLVRDGDLVIIVDPGILESQQILVDALKDEGLKIDDVDIVFITHSHLDHYRNVGMFPHAKILEYYGMWKKNTITDWSENLTPNIKVLHTPGHDYTGITIFVTTAPESNYPGVVAICGDVFWKEHYPKNAEDDAYASNTEKLRESREMVLKMADWIIPGHAGIYKSNNDESFSEINTITTMKTSKLKIAVQCKICGRQMSQRDKCQCRPYLCFKCCECGIDCDLCGCSHKR